MGWRYRVNHSGTQAEITVLTARAAQLLSLMPDKPKPDLSRFLLSPMPGLLTELTVKAGQEVKAGEKLAVIEAMKMENVLRADADAVVGSGAATGDTLAVDQAILEFDTRECSRNTEHRCPAGQRPVALHSTFNYAKAAITSAAPAPARSARLRRRGEIPRSPSGG